MLYSILIYVPEDLVERMSKEEEDDHIARHLMIHEKLAAQGKLGPVARLMPTSTAVQLRTNGEPLVIDGPFAETKEQLLGFYLVDCESIHRGGHGRGALTAERQHHIRNPTCQTFLSGRRGGALTGRPVARPGRPLIVDR